MAWCLRLPLDVQQQINYMRFQGTPSARAIKAFEIGGDEDYKFSVNAKDPDDYTFFPSNNGGRWRNGEWRGAPMTTKRRYVFIAHNRMRQYLGRKTDPYPPKVSAADRARLRAWAEQSAEYHRAQALRGVARA